MRVSFHSRRRHDSLPPQPRRSAKLFIIVGLLTTGTMAFATVNFTTADPPHTAPAVAAAEEATRNVVDERLHAHLRALLKD